MIVIPFVDLNFGQLLWQHQRHHIRHKNQVPHLAKLKLADYTVPFLMQQKLLVHDNQNVKVPHCNKADKGAEIFEKCYMDWL